MNVINPFKRSNSTLNFSFINELENSSSILFPENWRSNRAIDICSRVIANTVASIPITLYADSNKEKTELKNDIRYDMLHHYPNSYTNRFAFWFSMEYTKQNYGNAFALIHRFPKNIQLEFISPLLYTYSYSIEKGVLYYKFNNGKKYVSDDIIHFRRGAFDAIMGPNPYDILKEEIQREYFANQTVSNFYKNGAKGRLFLKTQTTNGNIKELKEALNRFRKENGSSYYNEKNEKVQGDLNNFVDFPMMPGNTEVQEIANDPNSELYLALIQDCDLKIAAHYQIPPQYLNILQAQTINNAETRQLDFKSSTIQSTLSSNRQELQMKLLSTEEVKNGMSIEYNTMATVELDHNTRMRGYESLQKTAWMTPNEIRRMEGYPSIEGGDEHLVFDQFTTASSLTKGDNNK